MSKRSSIISPRLSDVEQRNSLTLKVPHARPSEELRAEKAKRLEQFLNRSYVKSWSSRYSCNVLRYPNDYADVSLHPSYNTLVYHVNCDERYKGATKKYHKQFQKEMKHLIANQPNLCKQFYLKRILCYKTGWPPLHTKRELNNFVTKFFQLTAKQKKRVDYLMKTVLS
ncbi:hypothetical protein KR032_003008 [Drosophila birchii]|nr:hypothetical protein KR032_003008 [Drosophila birchii]